MKRIYFLIICWPLLNAAVNAETDWSGSLTLETRFFAESPQFAQQDDGTVNALILEPEWRYKQGEHSARFIPFYIKDESDPQRSHTDIRELYWRLNKSSWEILLGINRVFWGVAESRHLVDIINQTDQVLDIDDEDKLGQPMLQYSLFRGWGNLSLFVMPGFRQRTFAGVDGRLRTALPVDNDNALYESSRAKDHIDYALRYSHVLGDWDIGLAYFYGTSREPRFIPNQSVTRLIPVYDIINQFGADIQYTTDAWLWKFETIYREGQGHSFGAVVAGFEYTVFQLLDSSKDLGILFEWHSDGRDNSAAPSNFDDDFFAGLRLAFNDTDDTSILFGVIADASGKDRLYNLEAETRLSEHFKLEVRARIFSDAQQDSPVSAFAKDDYLQLQLQYHI